MRDAPRHVGPGRGALRAHQVGDVVERDHEAMLGRRRLLGGDAYREIAVASAAIDHHLALHQALEAGARLGEQLAELGNHVGERSPERFGFHPPASTPITPALAPASTASVKRRRLSMRLCARMRSSRCVRNSCVILLKVSPSWARSPSPGRTGTSTYRLPVETWSAAPISRRIGATRLLAKFSPIHTAESSTMSAMTVYISAKATCTPTRRSCRLAYSATLARVA